MAFTYKHYHPDTYAELTERIGQRVRLQMALNDVGLYTQVTLTPVAADTESPRLRIAQQLVPLDPAYAYLNPDGRWLGWEVWAHDDTAYTLSLLVDGAPRNYAIAPLPAPPAPRLQVDELLPYTIGGLAGAIVHGRLLGNYTAGGVLLGYKHAQLMTARVAHNHRLYRDADGWRLALYDDAGLEWQDGAPLNNLRLTLDWRGYIR